MDHHSSRRTRSPPFGYEPRHIINNRDFESPYNSFEGPPRHHPVLPGDCLGPIPGVGPSDAMGIPFMDQPRQGYPAVQRDRLPSTYRQTTRESYPTAGPPPRSSSPSYKILCITNINNKIDDMSVKSALMSDFCRFGDISVSVCHDNGERLAYIYFRSHAEAREARISKSRALFFDRPIDIEPIYEPNGSPVDGPSPPPPHLTSMVPHQPIFSPRGRRSLTPPDYSIEIDGPPSKHRRAAMPTHHAPTPPAPLNHRMISSPDYTTTHGAGYGSHGPSPAPMGVDPVPPPYDRRGGYGSHYPPPNPMSPYSTPPHDPYRSSYAPSHHHSQPPYPGPPPSSIHRSGRERMYTDSGYASSRSPRAADSYYMADHRGPPVPAVTQYQPPSRSSNHHATHHRASPGGHHSASRSAHYHSSAAPAAYRHRPAPASPPNQYSSHHTPPHGRPEPPVRFMSREFRRERFGIADLHGVEQEDGRPSRVLLVNNIDASKTELDLREMFDPSGIIEEIEVKKVTPEISSALIRFSSMDGAYKAKTANHGRYIGSSKCSIVYGKVSASRRLWIGGLSSSTTVPSLGGECSKYGDLVNMEYTSGRPYSYVEFETPNQAQFAAYHLRSTLVPAPDRKIRIEFVDPERSEKMSRHDANSQASDTKSRTTNESWISNEREASPHSVVGQKRSDSPSEPITKRACLVNDHMPSGANTFKQERLAAAAAAKARSASTASSAAGEPSVNQVELNNNTNNQTISTNHHTTNKSQVVSKHTSNTSSQLEAPSLEMLAQCSSIREIISRCSVSWPSQIALRNFTFSARIYLCSGRKQLIDKYLMKPLSDASGDDQISYPLLKITRRWRLHPQPKLEEVKRRMQSGNLGMLIITSRQEMSVAVATNNSQACSEPKLLDDTDVKHQQHTLPNGRDKFESKKTLTSGDSQTSQTPGFVDKNNSVLHGNSNDNALHESTLNNVSVESHNSTNTPTNAPNVKAVPQSQITTSATNTQSRPLRNLISYLEQKDAAGVISLSAYDVSSVAGGQQTAANSGSESGSYGNSKLLYAFPPCEFALNLIQHMASNLSTEISKEEFLLGVIVGNNVEGKS